MLRHRIGQLVPCSILLQGGAAVRRIPRQPGQRLHLHWRQRRSGQPGRGSRPGPTVLSRPCARLFWPRLCRVPWLHSTLRAVTPPGRPGAGHRAALNLLNAEKDAAGTELTLVQACVESLMNRLRLASAAGRLDEALLHPVNASLQPLPNR